MMKKSILAAALLAAMAVSAAQAETYKCVKGGQTVYSDLPCASGADRVDASADQVSRAQKRQAEAVRRSNESQLRDLEYQAARDRYAQRNFAKVPSR